MTYISIGFGYVRLYRHGENAACMACLIEKYIHTYIHTYIYIYDEIFTHTLVNTWYHSLLRLWVQIMLFDVCRPHANKHICSIQYILSIVIVAIFLFEWDVGGNRTISSTRISYLMRETLTMLKRILTNAAISSKSTSKMKLKPRMHTSGSISWDMNARITW